MRPLHTAKFLRHPGPGFHGVIDRDRQQEGSVVGHVLRALDREPPLATKIALIAGIAVRGHDCDEQCAVVNLFSDLAIPGIAATQLALVEPDLDTGGPEGHTDPLGRRGILGGVAEKDGAGNPGHWPILLARMGRALTSLQVLVEPRQRALQRVRAVGRIAQAMAFARIDHD